MGVSLHSYGPFQLFCTHCCILASTVTQLWCTRSIYNLWASLVTRCLTDIKLLFNTGRSRRLLLVLLWSNISDCSHSMLCNGILHVYRGHFFFLSFLYSYFSSGYHLPNVFSDDLLQFMIIIIFITTRWTVRHVRAFLNTILRGEISTLGGYLPPPLPCAALSTAFEDCAAAPLSISPPNLVWIPEQ